MVFAGALGGLVYEQADIVEVLALQGLLGAGIVMLFLNIWTTQDNTIYNFSIAGCSLLRTRRRRDVTIGGAVAGTLLALLGMYEWLVPYLVMLGTWIPPLGGVILAHHLARSHRRPPGRFEWPGIVAYLAGVLAACLLPGIPPVNGIVTAGVVHVAAVRFLCPAR